MDASFPPRSPRWKARLFKELVGQSRISMITETPGDTETHHVDKLLKIQALPEGALDSALLGLTKDVKMLKLWGHQENIYLRREKKRATFYVSMSDLVCHFDGTVQAYLGQTNSGMVLNLGMFNVIHVWWKKVALNSMHQYITILQEVRIFSHHNASFKHMSYLSSTMLLTWKLHQHPENREAASVLLQASFHCARPTCVKLFIEMKDVGSKDSLTKPHFGLTSAEVRKISPEFTFWGGQKSQKTNNLLSAQLFSTPDSNISNHLGRIQSIKHKHTISYHFIWGWLVEVAIGMCFYTRWFFTHRSDHPESPTCDPWELDQKAAAGF